jgi:hypothetical protein
MDEEDMKRTCKLVLKKLDKITGIRWGQKRRKRWK